MTYKSITELLDVKLTEEDVKQCLGKLRFEHISGNRFYDGDTETEFSLHLSGNTFKHLLQWIKEYNYQKGKEYGTLIGGNEIIYSIRNILKIK